MVKILCKNGVGGCAKGKKSMKKLRISALLLAGCLLTGCGSTEKTETKKDEKIKLQVTYSLKELESDETDVETIFAGYLKEHPNIEIESIPMSGSNFQMMSMIAAGNAPDIIRLSGFEDIPAYVSRKMIIPLDDYIAKSKVIDLNDSVNLFRYDGKERGNGSIYRCVKDWSVDTQLWINKKLFREAGVNILEQKLNECAKNVIKNEKVGRLTEYLNTARELCKSENIVICDCNHIWNMFRNNDVDINNLLSNRINHPTEEMGQIFAYELVKTMFEN